jgi:hypothetical protein
MNDLFLGKRIDYWKKLDQRAEDLGVSDFLQELAIAKGKISLLESHIEQMIKIINHNR